MSIESRVGRTGPVPATQSAMTVDMIGPAGVFARLDLPVIKTSPFGTDVIIKDQRIQITDMTAFKAFVKSLMQDEELTMRLDNGHGTVAALGMTASIVYRKDIHLKGMKGPQTVMQKTEIDGAGFKNTMLAINPSPLEIDLGTAKYEIRNEAGVKIAEQTGKTYTTRGKSTYTVTGTVTGGAAKGKAKLIGLGVEEDNWINDTIKFLDADLTLSDKFVAQYSQ